MGDDIGGGNHILGAFVWWQDGGELAKQTLSLHHRLLWWIMRTVTKQTMSKWAYLFHWANGRDFVRAHFPVSPERERSKMVEYWLPRLVNDGELKAIRVSGYGNKLLYTLKENKKKTGYHINHGLHCTDALVRFHVSKKGDYVSEREFRARRYNPVPEFAVRYDGKQPVVFLFEYSTADNYRHKKVIHKKLKSYIRGMNRFRQDLYAEPYLMYVIDAPDWEVEKFASRYDRNNLYFCNAREFFSIPYGEQLESPIYTWRGKKVSLYA